MEIGTVDTAVTTAEEAMASDAAVTVVDTGRMIAALRFYSQ